MRLSLFVILYIGLFALAACNNSPEGEIKIAILTPISHPSLEAAEQGFIETLQKRHPGRFKFVNYNAQGSQTLMHSEIEAIASLDYTLVLTLGSSASQMAIERLDKLKRSMPIVFTCVNDPIDLGIVTNMLKPGGRVTGVQELLDFEIELDALLNFKPEIKALLLPYNPCLPGMLKDKERIANLLHKRNITLVAVEIFQTNEIKPKVSSFITKVDGVIVLKDNTVVTGLEILVKLCEKQHIPLMASDLDSPDRGAAFGYGVHEKQFGIEAAEKADLILSENRLPGEIPITPVKDFTLRINRKAALAQGIDPALLADESGREEL